tara:strand:+ start:2330 stop:3781 length:1452 start_codon:yes stop_codon:yes gene_type:complete
VANCTAPLILWIDSSGRLSPTDLVGFGEYGLEIKQRSISELSSQSLEWAEIVVIRPGEGLEELGQLKRQLQQLALITPIVVRLGLDQFEQGIEAMKQGVATVVPAHNTNARDWATIIEGIEVPKHDHQSAYVFVDPKSRKLLALTERVAETDVTVLLTGPTGSGKEVLARILHDASPRHAAPFIAFNCAAMSETLIEDMLFGHEKGSFTGATKLQPGLFEQAQRGTIFLDEVGEMSFNLQAKFLRILQERTVTRLGGQKPIDLNIRVIAATNRNLKTSIVERSFREDLYFRLSTFKITLPPLRERPLDILPLADQFLDSHLSNGHSLAITPSAAKMLASYHWPGNVRELQNVIIRAQVLSRQGVIQPEHLIFDDLPFSEGIPPRVPGHRGDPLTAPGESYGSGSIVEQESDTQMQAASLNVNRTESLFSAIKVSECQIILNALQESKNRDQAAEKLGISPRTLRHKLQGFRKEGMIVTRAYAR